MSESLGLSKQQTKNLMKFISDNISIPVLGAGGGFAPIGFYGWSADYVTGAPQGWLRCEGQEVKIADYPELATFYASQHGASNYWGGDGITTFAVPDLRGEFIRGAGTNSHANQGNGGAVGEHQDGTTINPGWCNNESGGFSRLSASSSTYASLLGLNNVDADINTGNRQSLIGSTDLKTTPSSGAPVYANAVRPTNTSGAFFVKATVSGDANGEVYSTDETVCGTWTDGKTLYQKVIRKEVTLVGTGEVFLDPISDAESWFIVDSGAYQNSNYQGIEFPVSAINDVGGDYDFLIINYNFKTGRMWVKRGTNAPKYLQIVVKYTKTQ